MSYKILLFLAGFLMSQNIGLSQDSCGCNHIIRKSGTYRAKKPSDIFSNDPFVLDAYPGETICIQAGSYSNITFSGISGDDLNPVKIINCGGKVYINANRFDFSTGQNVVDNIGLQLDNCRYIHIAGTGDASNQYGIEVKNSKVANVSVGNFSTNVEIDHIEVDSSGFAGMMIKTDPNCNLEEYRNFTMYDVNVHHNSVKNCLGGEGLYIGNSFWSTGTNLWCNYQSNKIFPHIIKGLKVHHNNVYNTAWEGIQYGCSPDAEIFNNVVTKAGTAGVVLQWNGIQIGDGSGGRCYNNIVQDVRGVGVVATGIGANLYVYNNIVNKAEIGFYGNISDRTQVKEVVIANNSFMKIADTSIINRGIYMINSPDIPVILCMVNNLVHRENGIGGKWSDFSISKNFSLDSSNNLAVRTLDGLFENDTLFYPSAKSYLIDRGTDRTPMGMSLADMGINSDFKNFRRPFGKNYDIGANESKNPNNFDKISVINLSIYPSVVNDYLTVEIPKFNKKANISVVNELGQVILTQSLAVTEGGQSYIFSVNNLPSGCYFSRVDYDGTWALAKFVKP